MRETDRFLNHLSRQISSFLSFLLLMAELIKAQLDSSPFHHWSFFVRYHVFECLDAPLEHAKIAVLLELNNTYCKNQILSVPGLLAPPTYAIMSIFTKTLPG